MRGQGVMFSLWLLFSEFKTGFVPFLSTPRPCPAELASSPPRWGLRLGHSSGLYPPREIHAAPPSGSLCWHRGDSEQ